MVEQVRILGYSLGLGFLAGCSFYHLWLYSISSLPVFVLFLCLFHCLEFVITVPSQPHGATSSDAFLINNGYSYPAAMLFGVTEYLLERKYGIVQKDGLVVSMFGFSMCVFGQIIRSLAMAQASSNFTHQVAYEKKDKHQLVTGGLYRYLRHPSYFGYFVWALGTQILLANPLSTAIFAGVLYVFFNSRIQYEETHLIRFFGKDYEEYRARVPTRIPFIP